jgi:hypothetical protein
VRKHRSFANSGSGDTASFVPGRKLVHLAFCVQRAIAEMEAAVDRKAAAYSHNPMVAKIAEASKEAFRKKILEMKDEPA